MMNISIEDFTQTDYDEYMGYAIDQYAADNVKSGRWTAEQARSKSKEQFDYLLKDGLKSEGHFFLKICLEGKKVGIFWFHRNPKDLKKVFIYDARIEKDYQSQGIGSSAFPIIRARLKAKGVRKIALHVFTHNTGAIRLYERLGFEYESHNMSYMID